VINRTAPGSDHIFAEWLYGNLIAVHEPAGGVPAAVRSREVAGSAFKLYLTAYGKNDKCYLRHHYQLRRHQNLKSVRPTRIPRRVESPLPSRGRRFAVTEGRRGCAGGGVREWTGT